MKKLALAVTFTAIASTSYAGALSDPIVEPVMTAPVIEQEAAKSSAPTGGTVMAIFTIVTMLSPFYQ